MRKKTLIQKSKYINHYLSRKKTGCVGDILSILQTMKKINLKNEHSRKNKLFRNRTATQILKDGFTTGCTDDSIVFIAMAKTKGFSPLYIEALEKKWLNAPMSERRVRGHAFVMIKNLLIDPQRKQICADPNRIFSRYEIFGTGKEPYDLGLFDLKTSIQEFMDFKKNYKNN